MEDLLIGLAIGLVIAVPLATLVLIILAARQGRRLKGLEARLGLLERGVPDASEAAKPATKVVPSVSVPPSSQTSPTEAAEDEKGPWKRSGKSTHAPQDAVPASRKKSPSSPPRAVVLRAEKMRALGAWLAANWIYLVAAVSLTLAGIFLLQYGIEKGLLPPAARVAAALAFGALMVVGGEYLRRRWGDDEEAVTAFLPSVFSGAGIVTLFAAVLAALHLYALIGPVAALMGLVSVAALAIVLGWYSGPLLAALGVVGAMAAPFIVGGESETPELFYLYFGLITLVGMVIDAVRRWAWVTMLALVLGFGAAFMLYADTGGPEWLAAFVSALALAAIAVPVLSLAPAHAGAAMFEVFRTGLPSGWPSFPVRVVWGTFVVSVAALVLLSGDDTGTFWLCVGLLAILFTALAIWARKASALEDLAALPILGLLAALFWQDFSYGDVISGFTAFREAEPGTSMPNVVFVLAAIGAVLSVIAAWRSLSGARWPLGWAAGAALAGPLVMVTLEVWWQPGVVIGAYPWALSAAAMAVLMGLMAGWFARVDGDDKARVALMVLAALSMISFALVVVLSDAALTLALALTMLAAAALDRRFNMAALAWFVQVVVVVIGWRLIMDPGLYWADNAGLGHVIAAFAGSIAAMASAYLLLRGMERRAALIVLESAAWSLLAVFASVLIQRLLEPYNANDSHWSAGLMALVWLVSAANQLWRVQAGGKVLKWVRIGLATLFGAIGTFALWLVLVPDNPLLSTGETVLGPVLISTLALAYLLPALVFGFVAWRFIFLPVRLRILFTVVGAGLASLWLGLEIRHFWRGDILSVPGTSQYELYSYTIAMLLTGAGLLYQAIAKASTALRRVAMAVIAVTVAKVFLVDASGLTGLTRVFSFLALGLSLAGLAFLNRWAAGQAPSADQPQPD